MKETPASQEAFEAYYGLGPERSLPKLIALYEQRSSKDEAVPTTNLRTVAGWSAEHNWQERIIARIEEDAAEVRKRLQERAVKFRERIATAIEVDVSRLLQRLHDTQGEMLAESAADLEKLVKLYYQLTETPLAERKEITGKGGKPIGIEILFPHLTTEQLAEIASHNGDYGRASEDGPGAEGGTGGQDADN